MRLQIKEEIPDEDEQGSFPAPPSMVQAVRTFHKDVARRSACSNEGLSGVCLPSTKAPIRDQRGVFSKVHQSEAEPLDLTVKTARLDQKTDGT